MKFESFKNKETNKSDDLFVKKKFIFLADRYLRLFDDNKNTLRNKIKEVSSADFCSFVNYTFIMTKKRLDVLNSINSLYERNKNILILPTNEKIRITKFIASEGASSNHLFWGDKKLFELFPKEELNSIIKEFFELYENYLKVKELYDEEKANSFSNKDLVDAQKESNIANVKKELIEDFMSLGIVPSKLEDALNDFESFVSLYKKEDDFYSFIENNIHVFNPSFKLTEKTDFHYDFDVCNFVLNNQNEKFVLEF